MAGNYTPITDWSDRVRTYNKKGYVLIWVPEHPKSFGGWYYEHRLVMEREYGRVLRTWETVHHISVKTNTDPRSLFVCTRSEHDRAVWLTAP